MENYPILWRNVMGSLDTEIARKAFIAAAEMPSADRYQYVAEKYAREVDQLVSVLRPHVEFGFVQQPVNVSDEVVDDLMSYILKRHFVLFFGDRRRCWLGRQVAV